MAEYGQLPPFSLAPTFVNPLEVGQWIRWTTPDRIYEGQVLRVEGPSAVIHWLGGAEQVFPVVEGYFPPYGTGIVVIDKPRKAEKIFRDSQAGLMSVPRAAALLGVEPKRVRAMLRGGQLRGEQVDGKWKVVNGEDVMARLNYA